MKTRTELLQHLGLSKSQLASAFRDLGIDDNSGFSDEDVARIEDYVTSPKTPKTEAAQPTDSGEPGSVSIQGFDPERVNLLRKAQQSALQQQVENGQLQGMATHLAQQAGQFQGYVRAQELGAGLVEPETDAERQLVVLLRKMEDVFQPITYPGVSQAGNVFIVNLIPTRTPTPQISGS